MTRRHACLYRLGKIAAGGFCLRGRGQKLVVSEKEGKSARLSGEGRVTTWSATLETADNRLGAARAKECTIYSLAAGARSPHPSLHAKESAKKFSCGCPEVSFVNPCLVPGPRMTPFQTLQIFYLIRVLWRRGLAFTLADFLAVYAQDCALFTLCQIAYRIWYYFYLESLR
jgi:hypothetical protein